MGASSTGMNSNTKTGTWARNFEAMSSHGHLLRVDHSPEGEAQPIIFKPHPLPNDRLPSCRPP
ncbi:hypothetical protein Dxin01_00779 [Deinococcus xinjiangensis]|uniref:Uncharacterized protein n=1 Tax=Deinococcus xinjiangensis TaxID=457454 RepID=A0ABP9VAJ9_9DEIO